MVISDMLKEVLKDIGGHMVVVSDKTDITPEGCRVRTIDTKHYSGNIHREIVLDVDDLTIKHPILGRLFSTARIEKS